MWDAAKEIACHDFGVAFVGLSALLLLAFLSAASVSAKVLLFLAGSVALSTGISLFKEEAFLKWLSDRGARA